MSAAKQKGTRFEVAVRDHLNTVHGLRAYRPAQEGYRDTGDLHGLSPFVVQAKDWRDWQAAIREGLDGAQIQAHNAGESFGVVVVKRARRGPGDAYAVMTLDTFAAVLRRIHAAEGASS